MSLTVNVANGRHTATQTRVCVVQNIPASFTAPDLRFFFSDFVERDLFECFHFVRKQGVGAGPSGEKGVCVVRIRPGGRKGGLSTSFVNEFIATYNGKTWQSKLPFKPPFRNPDGVSAFVSAVTELERSPLPSNFHTVSCSKPTWSNPLSGHPSSENKAHEIGTGSANPALHAASSTMSERIFQEFFQPRKYEAPTEFIPRGKARAPKSNRGVQAPSAAGATENGGSLVKEGETPFAGASNSLSQLGKQPLFPEKVVSQYLYLTASGTEIRMSKSALRSHPDFQVPPELPQGNVGTPTKVLQLAINRCALRVSTLRMLGKSINYDFRRSTKRRYSEVPYTYPVPTRGDPVMECSHSDGPVPPTATPETQRKWTKRDFSPNSTSRQVAPDRQCQATSSGSGAAESVAASAAEQSDTDTDTSGDTDSDLDDEPKVDPRIGDVGGEEWDRHNDLHGVDEAYGFKYRTHTQARDAIVFEDTEAEDGALGGNIWDKGDASGLVHYTDDMYWESNAVKGDFDERNTDDWDVDYDGDGGRKAKLDAGPAQTNENGSHRRSKVQSSKRVSLRRGGTGRRLDAFDVFCARGFGGKYLRKYGWKSEAERSRLMKTQPQEQRDARSKTSGLHEPNQEAKAFVPSLWTREAAKNAPRPAPSLAAARQGLGFSDEKRQRKNRASTFRDGKSGHGYHASRIGTGAAGTAGVRPNDSTACRIHCNEQVHVSRFRTARARQQREANNPFPIGSIFDD